ncbi:MAG: ABC transporter ATP-binding protein [Lachnospiraceae bacterium]|jgi:ABC-2 type transport system ATP-binding protein|nr:ABC transporter ATP-binding protein [Lachnospiraceae bacterium]
MIPILECRDLTKTYDKAQRPALNHVNLKLQRGRIIGLLGPNGSGKTTLIKLANGLLSTNMGELLIDGMPVGIETKKIVSYLPERTYLNLSMTVMDTIRYFADFYADFREERAYEMLKTLQIDPSVKLKTLSKGTKEKVQLILVMSRDASLYILDEPIGGVDPAARDYILNTIITNYNENATVLLSTHLIADVESILDEVIFLKYGEVVLHAPVDAVREENGKSVDALFREVFKC